ncbi:MAG: hypothetical protein Q4C22_07080, partial [Bacillota bacterium]|nr:hypothetical protein [Bacillota bacterium]
GKRREGRGMNAVIYARYSSDNQREESIEGQLRECIANERGMKNTRGQPMSYNSIQHMLNNRRYMGEYAFRDIIIPDGIPVPLALFPRKQVVIDFSF